MFSIYSFFYGQSINVKYRKTTIPLKKLNFAASGLRDPKIEAKQRECDLAQKIISSLPEDGLINPLVVYQNVVYIGQNRLIALRYHAENDQMALDWDTPIECFEMLERPTSNKLRQFYLLYEVWDENDREIRKPLGEKALKEAS